MTARPPITHLAHGRSARGLFLAPVFPLSPSAPVGTLGLTGKLAALELEWNYQPGKAGDGARKRRGPAMWYFNADHPLRRLFAGLTEQTFMNVLGVADPGLVDYLSL